MPKMSGRELARSLEASRPTLKMLLMSGFAEEEVADAQAKLPEIIAKPFRPKTLLRKVRMAMAS
jgi:FixJ family two-component response regulator